MKSKKKIILIVVFVTLMVGALVASLIVTSVAKEQDSQLIMEFVPLGAHGDCMVARLGDVQLLVDAGLAIDRDGIDKIKYITDYLDKFMSGDDGGVWDYVIVTHPDVDHIGSFVTNPIYGNDTGVLHYMKEAKWTIGTLIDFDITKDSEIDDEIYSNLDGGKKSCFKTQKYKSYATRRDEFVEDGTIKNYYTATQCWYGRAGASKSFKFGSAKIDILYNYFYDHRYSPASSKFTNTELNIVSVCFLITHGDNTMLFTGDLEEYDSINSTYKEIGAETKLYENNKKLLSGGVDFYKAAHHGSKTSNSEQFIDKIRPNYVVISAVAGSDQHKSNTYGTFPVQDVMDNFLKYTDHIYITEYASENSSGQLLKPNDYYGTITVTSNRDEINVTTTGESDNDGLPLPITETKWFKENRTSKLNTYVFDLNGMYGLGHCTLVKYGHIDILLDCGINGKISEVTNSKIFIEDLQRYVVDGKLEYVVVTTAQTDSLSQMAKGGVLSKFKVGTLVDYGENTNNKSPKPDAWIANYNNMKASAFSKGEIEEYYNSSEMPPSEIVINSRMTISFFNLAARSSKNENDYSVCTLITFCGKKLLYTGDITKSVENSLVNSAEQKISNVDFYIAGGYGQESSNSTKLLEVIKPKVSAISATAGIIMGGEKTVSVDVCRNLITYAKKKDGIVLLMAQYVDDNIQTVCGDITYSITEKNGKYVEYGIECSGTNDGKPIGVNETEWFKEAA